ncbi:MAG TPA: NAD(+)/NADH kinase [Opitutaceae bacterium]|jgi:NAD+ kinase
MKSLRSIAFVVNDGKAGAPALARELMAISRAGGARVRLTSHFPFAPKFLKGADACCVIGGDGTLLGAAREAALAGIPIIGVNRGSLGFLTTFSADEARAGFAKVLAGEFSVDRRAMLDCHVPGNSQGKDLALNDVLIKAEENSRLVRLEVWADGELVTEYLCDGLIFSTATGSTAYNLSAGGPIIHPCADVIAMTPICPHTLSNRAIIFRGDVKIEVRNRSPEEALFVSWDGRRDAIAKSEKPIKIKMARTRLSLAQKASYEHFAVVRAKLKWTGGLTP